MPCFFCCKNIKMVGEFSCDFESNCYFKSYENSNKIFDIVGELKIIYFNSSFLFRQNQELFS